MKKRQSGVLLHISSLANEFGIGSLGKSAYDFVDFLEKSGQTYWQVLPLGPLTYGNSPYQSFSAFAGNPYFIDLKRLIEKDLLVSEDLEGLDFGDDPESVDYEKVSQAHQSLMEKVFHNFKTHGNQEAYQQFVAEQHSWLSDFADYMAIRTYFGNQSWLDWEDEEIRQRKEEGLRFYRKKLSKEIQYHKVLQFLFFQQWQELKTYANKKGIKIIGDMPIYVSSDSSDMWTNPHCFETDQEGRPTVVAGCPPDAFSETGQLWGNPLYDWSVMAEDNYSWWCLRLREAFKLYDLIRIDHFRGFEAYWEIPVGDAIATNGRWVKGPAKKLFEVFQKEFGPDLPLIVEDLGLITDDVIALRESLGLAGMKVLQFAFDVDEESTYLPHRSSINSVVYTGTHDNNSIRGWYEDDISEETRQFFNDYSHKFPDESASQAMIRLAWLSNSYLAITTMQDLLDLGSYSRMNTPSTIGNNWKWRMKSAIIDKNVQENLLHLTKLYYRQR